jgi:DNA-directed RNA polymerase III subunit RPC7
VLTEYSNDEKRICKLQIGFASRVRKSQYFVVETSKSTGALTINEIMHNLTRENTELPRYSDKYRPSTSSQPTLKRKELHQPFFPSEIFDGYFNPKKKRKGESDRPPMLSWC